MSSYSRIIFTIFFLAFTSIGCASSSSKIEHIDYKEDLFTMMALDSENRKDFKSTYLYYEHLNRLNPSEQYAAKLVSYYFVASQYQKMLDLSIEASKKYKEQREFYLSQSVIALIKLQKLDLALQKSKELLEEFTNTKNYEIVANVYYAKKDYKNAIKYYESAYAQNQNDTTLLKMVSILYGYLNQKDIALAYLETYLQQNGCVSNEVCEKLLLIYQEQGNIDGIVSILNKMYLKYKDDPAYEKVAQIIKNNMLMLLEKKDIKEAILFLEKNNGDQNKLLNLYYQDGQLKKALKLVRKMYKKTKDPSLLGKIAMYIFEDAKDKQKVLKHVIANFELALSSGINNPSYQNYYGYLLIDYNIDIKKGVSLVEQALKTSPKNLAYLDSLAWGYYKLGLCKKAKETMYKVIQTTGLNDQEIKYHWDMITNCKGND